MLNLGLDPGPKVRGFKTIGKGMVGRGLNDDRRPLLVRAEALVKNF